MAVDERYETGADGHLKVGGTEYEVTNISYSIDADTSEVQFTASSGDRQDAFQTNAAVTGMSYSGSFEHSGENDDLFETVMDTSGNTIVPSGTASDSDRIKLKVEDSQRTVIFHDMLVTSRSKDMPADDRTSVTYDWIAEKATLAD